MYDGEKMERLIKQLYVKIKVCLNHSFGNNIYIYLDI